MNDEKIRVIYLETGKKAVIREIEESLVAMQGLVHGPIDEYTPFEEEIALVCNAEGQARDLPMNRTVTDEDGELLDIIQGDFFLCGAPVDSASYESIPPETEAKYLKTFYLPEMFFQVNDEICAVKYDPDKEETVRTETR